MKLFVLVVFALLLFVPLAFAEFIDSSDFRFKLPENQTPRFIDSKDPKNVLQKFDQNFNLKVQDFLDPRKREFNFLTGDFNQSVDFNIFDVNLSLIGAPAGANTNVQFNDSGVFGGDANFIFQKSNARVALGKAITPLYRLDVRGVDSNDKINADIGLNFNRVLRPPNLTGVPVAGLDLNIGVYYYRISYYTALGETETNNTPTTITTTAGNQDVNLILPVSSDYRVIGRKIYRTKVTGPQANDYLLATIANNTQVNYLDNTPDSGLTGETSVGYFRPNTTTHQIRVNENQAIFVDESLASLGISALDSITSGRFNTAIGTSAGTALTSGGNNAFVGSYSGMAALTSGTSSAIGVNSLRDVNTGSSNTGVGYDALRGFYTGNNNTAIGSSVGLQQPGSKNVAGAFNVFVGSLAGYSTPPKISQTSNVYVGSYSGVNAVNQSYSILLGQSVNYGNQGGNFQIVIGAYSKLPDDNRTGALNIGNVIYGTGLYSTGAASSAPATNGRIGIKNIDPSQTLDVNGASIFRGDTNTTGVIYGNAAGVSIWADGNISAAGYITRTEVYDKSKGKALSKIKDADEYKTAGVVDDSKFSYSGVKVKVREIIGYKNMAVDFSACHEELEISHFDENNSAVYVPVQKCAPEKQLISEPIYGVVEKTGVSLDKENALLKQALYELKKCIAESKDFVALKGCIE